MTPPMHRRVRNVFVESGLTAGYIVQSLSWNDIRDKGIRDIPDANPSWH